MKRLITNNHCILYVLNGVWSWSIRLRTQEEATEFEEWMSERGYGFTRSNSDERGGKFQTFTYFGEFEDLGGKLQFEWRWMS